jgi:type IV secretory pathway VirB10-like protein
MATADVIQEQEEQEQEHLGGGRFNRLLGVVFVVVAMVGGVALALGVQSSGSSQISASQKSVDDPGSAARDRGEIEDLAAHGALPHAAPTVMPIPALPISQAPVQPSAPRAPSRYAQWAEEKYMKALESPEMVQAFHSGETLEIASVKGQQADSYISRDQKNSTISVHPAASPYTVMAGSILPAVLISGINSDLPGPILAQVSQNVLDSASVAFDWRCSAFVASAGVHVTPATVKSRVCKQSEEARTRIDERDGPHFQARFGLLDRVLLSWQGISREFPLRQ